MTDDPFYIDPNEQVATCSNCGNLLVRVERTHVNTVTQGWKHVVADHIDGEIRGERECPGRLQPDSVTATPEENDE